MNEFDGDVLGVGGEWAAPECEQAATLQKPVGHLAAGLGKTVGFAGEKELAQLVPPRQPLFDTRRQRTRRRHDGV